jgi:hypothetical protein
LAGIGFLFSMLAGCSYQSPNDIRNPIMRPLVWFSFARGEDIEAACTAASQTRIRAIYNADFRRQVRIYEIGATSPLQLDERIIGGENLLAMDFSDPLAQWHGSTASVSVTARQIDSLGDAFLASGLLDPRPGAPGLASNRTYWVVSSCRNGVFHRNGWLSPSDRYARIVFDKMLFALDVTGVAIQPPIIPGYDAFRPVDAAGRPIPPWYLSVE